MISRETIAVVFAVVLVMSAGCTGFGGDGAENGSGPESDGNGTAQDGIDAANDSGTDSDGASSTTEEPNESNETEEETTPDSDDADEEETAEEEAEATNESESTTAASEGEGEANGQEDGDVDEDDAAEETTNETDEQESSNETDQTADVTAFEESLRDEGIDVSSAEQDGDTLSLEYETSRTDEGAVEAEGAIVAGSYADLTGDGYESDRLEVTIYQAATGERIADYHIESEWAQQYNDGEISSVEYEERVTETIDTHV